MSEPSTNPMRRALRAMTHGLYVLSVGHAARDEQSAKHRDESGSEHRDESGNDYRDEYVVIALAMQCSVEPARVALSVSVNSRILGPLRAAGGAVLSVLDTSQLAAVRRYGTPGGVRNAPVHPIRTDHGHPIPPEASVWMALSVMRETDAGDHVLFVADVIVAGAAGAVAAEDATAHSTDADADAADAQPKAFNPLTLTASQFPYAG